MDHRPYATVLLNPQRIPALDGLRGLAVLLVMGFHTLPITEHHSTVVTLWNAFAKSCWVGVDVFFVLSGFLITRVLCQTHSGASYFANFYLRRALRIWPLYFTFLFGLLYALPAVIRPASRPPLYHRLLENQIWLWTFLQNFLQARGPHQLPGLGHFWTVAIEEQFYFVWPVVVFWLSRRSLLLFSLAVCSLEPLARLICLHAGYSTWAIRELTYLRLDSLLMGALLYLLLANTTISRSLIDSWLKLSGVAALFVLTVLFYPKLFLPYESWAIDVIGYSAVAVLAAALLYSCLQTNSPSERFFSAGLLRWFGKYSYAIYLFSIPVLLCFDMLNASGRLVEGEFTVPLVRFICSLFASTALALLSWRLLESPMQRLKSRFVAPRPSLVLSPVLK